MSYDDSRSYATAVLNQFPSSYHVRLKQRKTSQCLSVTSPFQRPYPGPWRFMHRGMVTIVIALCADLTQHPALVQRRSLALLHNNSSHDVKTRLQVSQGRLVRRLVCSARPWKRITSEQCFLIIFTLYFVPVTCQTAARRHFPHDQCHGVHVHLLECIRDI